MRLPVAGGVGACALPSAAEVRESGGMAEHPLEAAIFDLLSRREAGRTICPSEAAKAVDPEGWRRLMPQARGVAVGLARAGRLVITRKGRAVDPEAFKGVYRLRLPGDAAPGPDEEDAQ